MVLSGGHFAFCGVENATFETFWLLVCDKGLYKLCFYSFGWVGEKHFRVRGKTGLVNVVGGSREMYMITCVMGGDRETIGSLKLFWGIS